MPQPWNQQVSSAPLPWWKMLSNRNWETIEDYVRGEKIIVRTWLTVIAVWLASTMIMAVSSSSSLVHRASQAIAYGLTLVAALLLVDYVRRR